MRQKLVTEASDGGEKVGWGWGGEPGPSTKELGEPRKGSRR